MYIYIIILAIPTIIVHESYKRDITPSRTTWPYITPGFFGGQELETASRDDLYNRGFPWSWGYPTMDGWFHGKSTSKWGWHPNSWMVYFMENIPWKIGWVGGTSIKWTPPEKVSTGFGSGKHQLSGLPPPGRPHQDVSSPKDVHRIAATVTEPSIKRNTQILSQAAA